MRISVNKDDPGHHPLAHLCFVELNDKRISGCFTVDEEKKYVLKYAQGSDNMKFVNGEWEWEWVTEKVKGNFKIIFPDDWVFPVKYHKKKRLRKKLNKMTRR